MQISGHNIIVGKLSQEAKVLLVHIIIIIFLFHPEVKLPLSLDWKLGRGGGVIILWLTPYYQFDFFS